MARSAELLSQSRHNNSFIINITTFFEAKQKTDLTAISAKSCFLQSKELFAFHENIFSIYKYVYFFLHSVIKFKCNL